MTSLILSASKQPKVIGEVRDAPVEHWTDASGRKQIKGKVRLRGERYLYIDSSTNEGVRTVLHALESFIRYQSAKTTFPGYAHEDIIQELYRMSVSALPNYKSDRNTSLLTFIQNYVKNKVINLCKFHSEQRRIASYLVADSHKYRCNACRHFFVATTGKQFVCPDCGATGKVGTEFKSYNRPIMPTAASAIATRYEEGDSSTQWFDQCTTQDSQEHFLVISRTESEELIRMRADLEKMLSQQTDINRTIVRLSIEGFSTKEISAKVGLSESTVLSHMNKTIQSIRNQLEA